MAVLTSVLAVGGCADSGAVVSFENKLLIHRPIKEVFSFLSNLEHLPLWNYYVRSVVPQTPPGGVGGRFLCTRESDHQQLQITEWTQDELVSFKTLPPERAITVQFRIAPQGEHTLLIDARSVDAANRLFAALLRAFARERIRRAVAANLNHLREHLETGRTTLQNGRVSTLPRVATFD